MDTNKLSNILLVLALLAAACCFCYCQGRKSMMLPEPEVVTTTDTLIIRDTIRLTKLVPVKVTAIDTIIVRDTVLVKERKTYQGEDYRAVISGYLPQLDTIEVFPKTITITNTATKTTVIPRKKWGVSAVAGPAAIVDFSGAFRAGIGVSVGISYTF